MSEPTRPGPAPSRDPDAPRGWVGNDEKSAFTRRMWAAAGVGLVLQIVLPMVLSFVSLFAAVDELTPRGFTEPSRFAYWRGALWMIGEVPKDGNDSMRTAAIFKWTPGEEGPPVMAAIPIVTEPSLVAAGGALWIIGSDAVIEMSNTKVSPTKVEAISGPKSRPFALRARPAMIVSPLSTDSTDGDESAQSYELYAFDGARWDSARDFGAFSPTREEIALELLAPIERADGVGAVVPRDGGLYYLPDMRELGALPVESWERIADLELNFAACRAGDEPVVVVSRGGFGFGGDSGITGYRRTAAGWERSFDLEWGIVGRLGVFELDDRGRVLVVADGMPGSLTAWEIDGDRVVRRMRIGEAPPSSRDALTWISVVIGWFATFLFVPWLSRAMEKSRVTTHVAAGRTATYATLLRRTAATAIDAIIAAAPVIAFWIVLFGASVPEVEEHGPAAILSLFGFIALAGVWSLVCAVAFALMEAHSGRTLGKRVVKIRVLAADLTPIGLSRALARNLLKVVADAAMSGLVGVIAIALSPSWQRVGDLAARTVVVRDEGSLGDDA